MGKRPNAWKRQVISLARIGQGPDTWKRRADARRQEELIQRSHAAKNNIAEWRKRVCKAVEEGEYERAMNILNQIGMELKHV